MTPEEPMRVIYIIGPYRAKTLVEIGGNIKRAREAAAALWALGFAVICPHTNSGFFDGEGEGGSGIEYTKGYLEIQRRCGEVYVLPNWQASEGSRAEIELAMDIAQPMHGDIEGVRAALGDLLSNHPTGPRKPDVWSEITVKEKT